MISAINYPVYGKWVCQEIKNNVVKQLQGVEPQKAEIKKLIEARFLGLWKEDSSPTPEAEILKHIQEDSQKAEDIDLLLNSFDESNLFKFFEQCAHKEVSLQQFLHRHGQISYEILNSIALAQSRIKDFFRSHVSWDKVLQFLGTQN